MQIVIPQSFTKEHERALTIYFEMEIMRDLEASGIVFEIHDILSAVGKSP
jgi:hypothetical protein